MCLSIAAILPKRSVKLSDHYTLSPRRRTHVIVGRARTSRARHRRAPAIIERTPPSDARVLAAESAAARRSPWFAACRRATGHLISKIFLFFTEVCGGTCASQNPIPCFPGKTLMSGHGRRQNDAQMDPRHGRWRILRSFFCTFSRKGVPRRAVARPHHPSYAHVAAPGASAASVTATAPVASTAPAPAARAPTSSGSSSSRSPRGSQRGIRP